VVKYKGLVFPKTIPVSQKTHTLVKPSDSIRVLRTSDIAQDVVEVGSTVKGEETLKTSHPAGGAVSLAPSIRETTNTSILNNVFILIDLAVSWLYEDVCYFN